MKKNIAAWKNRFLGETLKREATMQDVLYLCLVLWAVMPMMMQLIASSEYYLPPRTSLLNISQTNRLSSAYAKYFYVLGLATVCVALAGLSRALPGPKNLLRAAWRRPWHTCLALMLFWTVLSTLFSDNPISRFWGLRYQSDGLGSWIIYAAVYVCAYLLSERKKRLALLQLLSFVGALCSLLICKQVFIALRNGESILMVGKASFFNINHCAYFLTVSIFCSAGLWLYSEESWRKNWNLVFFAVQVYALLLNGTLGSFLAVALALPITCVLWFLSGRRGLRRPLILCAVFLALFLGDNFGLLPGSSGGMMQSLQVTQSEVQTLIESPDSAIDGGSGRVSLWLGALDWIAQHPIFGVGPDSAVRPSARSRIIRPHNEFLERAMYMGLPALAAYLGAIFSLLAYQLYRLREVDERTLAAAGSVTAYLISSFFGLTLYYTAPFFYLVWGMAARTDGDQEAERVEPPVRAGGREQDSGVEKDSGTEQDSGAAELPAAEDTLSAGGREELPETADSLENAAGKNAAAGQRRRFSRRDIAALAAVLVTVAVYAVLTVIIYQEAEREYRDNQNIIIASAVGEQLYDSGADLSDTYWFDPASNSLYPTDSPAPDAYGEGTAINGKSYLTSEASSRRYNLEQSYRQCVLMVRAEVLQSSQPKDNGSSDMEAEGSGGTEAGASGANMPVLSRREAGEDFKVRTEWVYVFDRDS